MSARTGMANLIRRLRGMTQAGTADYSLIIGDGSTVFWYSDDHLYEFLDIYATDLYGAPLVVQPEQDTGGTVRFLTYFAPLGNLEEATSGTVYWSVRDSTGATVGTANYDVDYVAGIIRFGADRGGTAYYLRARSYNLYRAAAETYRSKAAKASEVGFSFSSDNQRFDFGKQSQSYLDMAAYYDKQAGFVVSTLRRTDLLPNIGQPNDYSY